MSELKVNTITEASTGTGITFTNSIVSGNSGTITQRSSSSSSPTFTRSSGTAIDSTVLGHLYGSTNFGPNDTTNATHIWFAWDYGADVTRKITELEFKTTSGAANSTGIFLEGSNVASPNATSGHSDWTQLHSFGTLVNDNIYYYSSSATALKYRHYRIRFSWSSANYPNIQSFALKDTDSNFDARTPLNATGSAPIYACRAWVNFNGNKDTSGSDSTSNTNRLINGSGNVTSVLRTAAGQYTVNFTTAMPDDDYCVVLGGCIDDVSATVGYYIGVSTASGVVDTKSTTQLQIMTKNQNGAVVDLVSANIAIFR